MILSTRKIIWKKYFRYRKWGSYLPVTMKHNEIKSNLHTEWGRKSFHAPEKLLPAINAVFGNNVSIAFHFPKLKTENFLQKNWLSTSTFSILALMFAFRNLSSCFVEPNPYVS
jgi:hypothetical protein